MIVLIYYRVKNTHLKPNNKKKKVIHSRDVFKFTCNLNSWLHIVSFITNKTNEMFNRDEVELKAEFNVVYLTY